MAPTAANGDTPLVLYLFWFGAFCVASVSMTIVNKLVTKEVRVPYLLLGFQQVVAIVIYVVMHFSVGRRDPKSMWHIKPITLRQVQRLLVVGVNFTFILASSLIALPMVSVATVVVFRNSCTCVIAALEYMLFGLKFSRGAWLALAMTIVGSVIYASSDISFHTQGYFWQAMNSVFYCFGQLYEKWNMSRTTDQTATGVATIKAALSLPVVCVMAPMFGEVTEWLAHPPLSRGVLALVWLSGAGAIGLGIIYMTLYQIASATATTVGGNFNKVVSIIVGSVVFANSLNEVQFVGLAVCMGGSLWWSLESLWSPRPAAKKE